MMSCNEIPTCNWSRNLSTKDPSNSVHYFSRPPVMEALRLLPVAARVGSYIITERYNNREPIFDLNGIGLEPPHPGPYGGVPLGGIGGGAIGRGFRGDFRRWSLYPGKYIHKTIENNQFCIRIKYQNTIFSKVLSILPCNNHSNISDWNWGIPPENITYHAVFPRAWTVYKHIIPDVHVTVLQTSPVIPNNYSDTSLPTSVFQVFIDNDSDHDIECSVMFVFENNTALDHAMTNISTCASTSTADACQHPHALFDIEFPNSENKSDDGDAKGVVNGATGVCMAHYKITKVPTTILDSLEQRSIPINSKAKASSIACNSSTSTDTSNWDKKEPTNEVKFESVESEGDVNRSFLAVDEKTPLKHIAESKANSIPIVTASNPTSTTAASNRWGGSMFQCSCPDISTKDEGSEKEGKEIRLESSSVVRKEVLFCDEGSFAIATTTDKDSVVTKCEKFCASNLSKSYLASVKKNDKVAKLLWEQFHSLGDISGCCSNENGVENSDTNDNGSICQYAAAVCVRKSLSRHSKENVFTFALAWDHPVVRFGSGRAYDRYYCRFVGRNGFSSPSIAAYALRNIDRWHEEIYKWQHPVLSDDTLPEYYRHMLFNESYFLVDGGTLWLEAENYDYYNDSSPNSGTAGNNTGNSGDSHGKYARRRKKLNANMFHYSGCSKEIGIDVDISNQSDATYQNSTGHISNDIYNNYNNTRKSSGNKSGYIATSLNEGMNLTQDGISNVRVPYDGAMNVNSDITSRDKKTEDNSFISSEEHIHFQILNVPINGDEANMGITQNALQEMMNRQKLLQWSYEDMSDYNNEIRYCQGNQNKVGKFLYLEGHEYLMYNTYDVHFYASFALLMLWPQLELSLQRDFAKSVSMEDESVRRLLGEGDLRQRKVKGSVPHDLGSPSEDPFYKTNIYNFQDVSNWKDLGSKFVLQIYRDYIVTDSPWFLVDTYEAVLTVMDHTLQFDRDNDGMIENDGFPDQTYDIWIAKGVHAYCGGLWIAACHATSAMALKLNDATNFEKYLLLATKASNVYTKVLWNGGYLNYDTSESYQSTSIMTDMLAGQWYARVCGLPDIVSKDIVYSCYREIYKMNVVRFGKGKLLGAVNGMRTSGVVDECCIQSREVWTGTTYAYASALLLEGNDLICDGNKEGYANDNGDVDAQHTSGYRDVITGGDSMSSGGMENVHMVESSHTKYVSASSNDDNNCVSGNVNIKSVDMGTSYGDNDQVGGMGKEDFVHMAFESARGIHDAGWQEFGYWFATPEGWEQNGNYRSLGYMRPLSIWAMQFAINQQHKHGHQQPTKAKK